VQIERARLFLVPLALREPFVSSLGTTRERRVLLLALDGINDQTGWSECVAGETSAYTPETTESAWTTLRETLLPAVVGRDFADAAALGEALVTPDAAPGDQPMARAAVEMAGWDLFAKLLNVPLWEALGGERRPVPAGVSLGLADDDEIFRRVERFAKQGYRRVKLKIEPGRDVELLAAVHERFPEVPLAADANGAYTLIDRGLLRELDEVGIEMLEQPLPAADLDGHAELQAVLRTPICLDESVRSAADARRALDLGSCRIVNVKPGRVGGLVEAHRIQELCQARGIPAWCGGMLESGIGRAHNVALATLSGFTLPGDLSASRRYWERDLVTPEWELEDGALVPLDAPGLCVLKFVLLL
jgi:O-succinylbenzoate synthase